MRLILSIILFNALALQIYGQIDPNDSRYARSAWAQDAYEPDSLVEVYNALKLDPLQVFRGEISAFYERRISDRISVELGLGVTRRNWTLPMFNLDADDLRRNITVLTGPSGRLGVRYYFTESPELNGMYIMPQIAYRRYDKRFGDLDSTGTLTGDTHLDRREIREFNITVGYQQLSVSSNFFFDIYIGLGYVQRNNREVKRLPVPVQSLYATESKTEYGFIPVIGLKLGWGF